jgi:probable HAF family extracellular repeat protein
MNTRMKYSFALVLLCLTAVIAQTGWHYSFFSAGNFPGATYSVPLGVGLSKTVGYYVSSTKNDAYVQTGASFVDAAPPGSFTSYLTGINRQGVAVGGYCAAQGGCNPETGEQGYSYNSNTAKIQTIVFPMSGAASTAYGINDMGVIVGGYCPNNNVCPSGQSNPTDRGFVDNHGTFTTIDFPGAQATSAFAINNAGTIVGFYVINNTGPHSFIYKNDTFTTIDFPGSSYTVATAINTLGEVAGLFASSTGLHGFVFYNGSFAQIDKPNATGTSVTGINDRNELVGGWWPTIGFKNFKAVPVAGPTQH